MDSESITVTYDSRGRTWSPPGGLPLREYAPKMKVVSLHTIQSHLAHPRMRDLGQWDMVVEGHESEIEAHIRDTFLLYKMHPQRVAEIDKRLRKLRDDPLTGILLRSPELYRLEFLKDLSEIDITLRHSSFHSPPEDVDCLKLEMRLSSQDTFYGRQLRAFLSWIWLENGGCRGATFVVATKSKDANRVLRNGKPDDLSSLEIGWESTHIAQWMEEDRVRQQNTKAGRKAARNCIMCGQPLGRLPRLLWMSKHGECKEFLD